MMYKTGHSIIRFLCVSFFAILSPSLLSAQTQVLRVYDGSAVVFQKNVDEMDSIKTVGCSIVLYYADGNQSFFLADVDSLAFPVIGQGSDTSDVDTATAVHIVWNNGTVSVSNPYSTSGVSVDVTGEKVNVSASAGRDDIVYWLEGSTSSGDFTLTTDSKFILLLDGVSISSADAQAVNILSDYRGVVHLAAGTVNNLADASTSGGKGALQSRGRFVFQGDGTLNVTGNAKHGIQSSGSTTVNGGTLNVLGAVKDGMNVDNFIMTGGTVSVTATGDGIDGDQGYILISGGVVTVNCTSDDVKGICCDSTLTIEDGNISVTVSGLQSKALKTKENLVIAGGTLDVYANGSVALEASGNGYDPSYCTGIKVDGIARFFGGDITVNCSSSNAGGKAVSADGDIYISGGTLTLTAEGPCAKYTDATGTYDSYSSTCMKSDASIYVSGGIIIANAGGRAISADGNYVQSGGSVSCSTTAAGFTTIGSGTSCTDGFAPACLKSDANITFTGGTFSGVSTGKGGRGIVCDSLLTMGGTGIADSALWVYVKTSGAAVNASSGGGWPGGGGSNTDQWKGLPKGVKVQGNIVMHSGHLQSFCAQTSGDPTGEAIETKDSLLMDGGYMEANAYDDAINATNHIRIDGGHLWAYARGNDGIDCNGSNIYINGGTVIAYGASECAIDDNADNGGTHLFISNATVIAIGGRMGAIEGTPSLTGQKYLLLGSSGGGMGGGGGNGSLSTAANGFCIKDSDGNEVMTYKWNTIASGNSGFADTPPSKRISGVFVTSPDISTGTYRYYSSPTITGGTNWHGLYSGATVTTSGNGTSVTAR